MKSAHWKVAFTCFFFSHKLFTLLSQRAPVTSPEWSTVCSKRLSDVTWSETCITLVLHFLCYCLLHQGDIVGTWARHYYEVLISSLFWRTHGAHTKDTLHSCSRTNLQTFLTLLFLASLGTVLTKPRGTCFMFYSSWLCFTKINAV